MDCCTIVDQPAGTGYSVVSVHDDVRELATAADQGQFRSATPHRHSTARRKGVDGSLVSADPPSSTVVVFLSNFYKAFPEMEFMDVRRPISSLVTVTDDLCDRPTSQERATLVRSLVVVPTMC